jgi:GTPase SAR1 family protein
MEEINIVVLGSPQSGKSTFIQRAFDLRSPPNSRFTQRKMSMDGNVYVVRLVELTFDDLDLDDYKRICWPDTIAGTPVPVIDGAFTLYDVMNRESLVQVPETLSKWLACPTIKFLVFRNTKEYF